MRLSKFVRGFFVVPLSKRLMAWAASVSYRQTPLAPGQSTVSHKHRFFSFYFVKDIQFFKSQKDNIGLPRRALVIVFPFAQHGWSNSEGTRSGYVYDLTPAHAPHDLIDSACS
jgi:hypothetical protein